ncbi:hypothetical protein [Mesorhizobium sp. WSM3224]|uniref:hypothetical protein n=1 Tax=Mesorhizobium sp. WSM3224 TaxID=1040986 RepID=UPI000483B16F|nr:hypothetical protein [Mesorhizobium sp. WSM3224]
MVTADALHCHTRMAQAITERGGDYLLALKGNRRHWVAHANQSLTEIIPALAERTETSHGRDEWRQAEIVAAAIPLMPGHKAFIRITSRRDKAEPVTRLFMTSTLLSPQQAVSAHTFEPVLFLSSTLESCARDRLASKDCDT